jgi:hypothetical protein
LGSWRRRPGGGGVALRLTGGDNQAGRVGGRAEADGGIGWFGLLVLVGGGGGRRGTLGADAGEAGVVRWGGLGRLGGLECQVQPQGRAGRLVARASRRGVAVPGALAVALAVAGGGGLPGPGRVWAEQERQVRRGLGHAAAVVLVGVRFLAGAGLGSWRGLQDLLRGGGGVGEVWWWDGGAPVLGVGLPAGLVAVARVAAGLTGDHVAGDHLDGDGVAGWCPDVLGVAAWRGGQHQDGDADDQEQAQGQPEQQRRPLAGPAGPPAAPLVATGTEPDPGIPGRRVPGPVRQSRRHDVVLTGLRRGTGNPPRSGMACLCRSAAR